MREREDKKSNFSLKLKEREREREQRKSLVGFQLFMTLSDLSGDFDLKAPYILYFTQDILIKNCRGRRHNFVCSFVYPRSFTVSYHRDHS